MKFLATLLRKLLSLRYKLVLQGEELLKKQGAKLFLPNHQALVDPQLLGSYLFRYENLVPVIAEEYYNLPLIQTICKKLHAVPVSDLTKGKRDLAVLKNIYNPVLEALSNGHNVLIYPSGQIANQGYERIFNKQSAYRITQDLPSNVSVIGVRIRGLWGSMWSKAATQNNQSPNFIWTLFKGFGYALANGFFFLPKRTVTLEFEDLTNMVKEKSTEDRKAFNQALEDFYNLHGEEELQRVPYFFWQKEN